MNEISLKGEKVLLRERRLSDAAKEYAWRHSPDLSRFEAASPLQVSFAEFLAYYAEELQYPTPRQQRFAIEDLRGNYIGNCMYYDIDARGKEAQLGILIGDSTYWNQGYGADALGVLLDHGFTKLDLARIYLYTLDWNLRAQTCFGKCGFAPRGRETRNGHIFILMDLDHATWQQNRGASIQAETKETEIPD